MTGKDGLAPRDGDKAVRRRSVNPINSWFARLRLHTWVLRPILLLFAGLGLLTLCWFLYGRTPAESFQREVVVSTLGAVVTIIGATLVALFALRKQLRALAEKRTIRRFADLSWKWSAISVGKMEIPGIAVIASCTQGKSWETNTVIEFSAMAESRGTNEIAAKAREVTLPELRKQADNGKLLLFDDECVDVVDADLSVFHSDGRRLPHYTLTPAKAQYFDFAVTTSRLDAPTNPLIDSEQRTLRELWGNEPASLLEVSRLPAMAKLGSGTVVVTKDDRLVLGVRGKTFIASDSEQGSNRRSLHFVAEGISPRDCDSDGLLNPAIGAVRGLDEELNIGSSSRNIGRAAKIVPTGVFFDQQRWQPCFSYLCRLDIDWDELQTAAPIARDSWEVEALISLPFDIAHTGVRSLLYGTHPDFRLASNHAAAMLWFALLHRHGYHEMRDYLLT